MTSGAGLRSKLARPATAQERITYTWAGAQPYQATAIEIQLICDSVSDGTMPLWEYRFLHPSAALSEEDKSNFCAWADQMERSEAEEAAH